jgi:hypothetical protein
MDNLFLFESAASGNMTVSKMHGVRNAAAPGWSKAWNTTQRLLAALALSLGVFAGTPFAARAATDLANNIFDVGEGKISIEPGTNADTVKVYYNATNWDYVDNIPAAAQITIIGTTTDGDKVIVAHNGVTANVMLQNVNIDVSGTEYACAFAITGSSSVNLTLSGANALKSASSRAGLQAASGNSVAIAGAGSLTVTGGSGGAGIGGSYNESGGTITISGGTITAKTGGYYRTGGAGGGAGGTIIIRGGNVTAAGNDASAGIGGGGFGSGAGIGGGANGDVLSGRCGDGGNILIYGENTVVTARRGNALSPRDIGAGHGGAAGNVFVALPQGSLTLSATPSPAPNAVAVTANPASSGTVMATLPAPFDAAGAIGILSNPGTAAEPLSVITTFTAESVSFELEGYGNSPLGKTGAELTASGAAVAFITFPTLFDVGEGKITFEPGSTPGTVKVYYNATTWDFVDNIPAARQITVTGTSTDGGKVIVAHQGVTANVRLHNVSIDVGAAGYICAFEIAGGSAVNLALSGTNTLKSGGYRAGLQVPSGNSITISGTAADSLLASGGASSAGIGGGNNGTDPVYNACGAVNVNGGAVIASGSPGAAGIGGGVFGAGGAVAINGGAVIAKGYRAVGAGQSGSSEGTLAFPAVYQYRFNTSTDTPVAGYTPSSVAPYVWSPVHQYLDIFAAQTVTSRGTPYAWLDGHGLAANGDYEAADLGDPDGDGFFNWQEYVAVSDPGNAASFFRVTAFPGIAWWPSNQAGRVYTVTGKTSLTDAGSWASPTNAAHRFFKVKVELD